MQKPADGKQKNIKKADFSSLLSALVNGDDVTVQVYDCRIEVGGEQYPYKIWKKHHCRRA